MPVDANLKKYLAQAVKLFDKNSNRNLKKDCDGIQDLVDTVYDCGEIREFGAQYIPHVLSNLLLDPVMPIQVLICAGVVLGYSLRKLEEKGKLQ